MLEGSSYKLNKPPLYYVSVMYDDIGCVILILKACSVLLQTLLNVCLQAFVTILEFLVHLFNTLFLAIAPTNK